MPPIQEESDAPWTATTFSLCRSLLFLPASNPRAIEKARTLQADMIVLDLEDAVKDEDKADARAAAVAAAQAGFGGRPVAIRVNASGTAAIMARTSSPSATCAADFVVLAKAESAKQVHDAGLADDQAGAGDDRDAAAR